MGRPGQTASAAARALTLRLSMQSGTSTTLGHGLDGPGQHVDLVHTGGADVDVEDVGAGRHLGDGLFFDHAQVAGAQGLSQPLLAGGVDALADEHRRPAAADDHFLAGAEYSSLHF